MKTITITIAKDESAVDALRHVAKLVEEGYLSGHNPNWDIETTE
jgi:hypothetical protein